MGTKTRCMGRRKKETELKRALRGLLEETGRGLEPEAVERIASGLCDIAKVAIEDVKRVGELNRRRYPHRHWYSLGLGIGEDSIALQNVLEGAGSSPPQGPACLQIRACILRSLK